MNKVLVLAVVVGILSVIFFPLLVIWSANTLFPILAIEYSLANWAAVLILGLFLRGYVTVKNS